MIHGPYFMQTQFTAFVCDRKVIIYKINFSVNDHINSKTENNRGWFFGWDLQELYWTRANDSIMFQCSEPRKFFAAIYLPVLSNWYSKSCQLTHMSCQSQVNVDWRLCLMNVRWVWEIDIGCISSDHTILN